jgi:predicted DNA-binding transcriptional regulator YafY
MTRDQVTLKDLMRASGVSRSTVYRLIADCRRELGMDIECKAGLYRVRDWGLFNRNRVVMNAAKRSF